ncbi:MAG: leucine-rich repeat protein [Lachnospiraceae bacterium]|nr:leucine-rich repeat protein [Lachnospiraceae bacterium]
MTGTKRRVKKPIRRAFYCAAGTILGTVFALRVNAAAPITNITVEEGKISVEDYEYFKMPTVIKVTLPAGLQQIGFSSFEGCTQLSNINLPDGLSVIDNRAFARCESLEKIDIPESTVFIGNAAFYGCTSLDDVVLPANITGISNNLFYGCTSLSKITLPEKLTSVGQQSFYNCKRLAKVELPASVTKIDDGAFYDCSALSQIVIPDSVTEIGQDAFEGCNGLTIVCGDRSYAANYAEANGIRHTGKQSETVPAAVTETKPVISTEDIPATGVNTPYTAVMMLMLASMAGLVFCRFHFDNVLYYDHET